MKLERQNKDQKEVLAPGSIRVLVVDDSALMRKLISEMLGHFPEFDVVATARDGQEGLLKAKELKPDVITLDVEMPRMNGLEFLDALMPVLPIPVVMISSLTMEGAETTMACLHRGAVDFVTKPSGSISIDIGRCENEIAAKVRVAAHARVRSKEHRTPTVVHESVKPNTVSEPELKKSALPDVAPKAKTPAEINSEAKSAMPLTLPERLEKKTAEVRARVAFPPSPAPVIPEPPKQNPHPGIVVSGGGMDAKTVVVAIASSTGGPAALHELLPHLPGGLNAAYLLVQHLPAGFTRSLADRLDHQCELHVREAQAGDTPERGVVLVATSGQHLELDAQGRVKLNNDPPLWGVRPAADVMMRSVATCFGERAIGVVLTGMGRDGAMGAKAIYQVGGHTFAQDEATCVVYGMPRAAVETGGVSRVEPLPSMAKAIVDQILSITGEAMPRRAA